MFGKFEKVFLPIKDGLSDNISKIKLEEVIYNLFNLPNTEISNKFIDFFSSTGT